MDPVAIEADRGAGTLTIVWDDGHTSHYGVELLRWSCPCAECAGEWGRPGGLDGLTLLPPPEFALEDVHAVGSYAIMPIWASGHRSGIYSFEYLRDICPCQTCAPHRSESS